MTGYVDINGKVPCFAKAKIELRNEGEVIGTTVVRDDGTWHVKGVSLPIGEHTIKATATLNGRERDAGTVNVDIYDPSAIQWTGDDDEIEAGDDSESTLSALSEIDHPEYKSLLAWVALNGYAYLDTDRAERVLIEAGRDIDEFTADVTAYAETMQIEQED